MTTVPHRKFDMGVNTDIASFGLPEGYVHSAKNILFDKVNIARKRGGFTGLGANATYLADNIGALVMDDGSARLAACRGAGGGIVNVDMTTGAMTLLGGSINNVFFTPGGRPFQHYGFLCFPGVTPGTQAGISSVAGATGSVASYVFTAPTTVSVTSGDKRITCAAADNPLTNLQVGQIVNIAWNGTLTSYVGRITALISTTAFEVWPTPDFTVTGAPIVLVQAKLASDSLTQAGMNASVQGKVGMSFQGRICLGSCVRQDYNGANRVETYPRRFYFSSTLLENDATGNAGHGQHGAVFLTTNAFPDFNYFDIPVQEEITAMTPTGFGDALIFSAYRTFRLTGNLSTQFGTTPSITWAVREVPNSVGCMSERSLQRTPRGVIFAHSSGIYVTDGSKMNPLLHDRRENEWKDLIDAGGTGGTVILGSGIIRGNHYYICGLSSGQYFAWMCNLNSLAWTTLTGKAQPGDWLMSGIVQDPVAPNKFWGLKVLTVSSTLATGQLIRADSMFYPTSATRSDRDGTLVNFELVTAAYIEGAIAIYKNWIASTVEYENLGGANVTVTPGPFLDAAELPAGGTSYFLQRQDSFTITAASNAIPIVVTCGAHDIKQDSWVIVKGVLGNTNANGRFRVQSVTATTVTLMGSYGNGAYVSGGTITGADTKDFPLTEMGDPGGSNYVAIEYRINDTDSGGAGGADSFELYGIMHTYEARDPSVE